MLENLDAIHWAGLSHAHGPATDVPGLLRTLLSPDEEERERAFTWLFGTIWHQGSVYEASSYAVPFLFELLQSPETPDPGGVAQLLGSLAHGSHQFAYDASRDEQFWREQLAKKGLTLEEMIEQEERWVRAAWEAVGQQLPLLYTYLQDPDEMVRLTVARALSLYPEHARATIPLLEAALAREQDADAIRFMEEALAKLRLD